MLIIYTLKTIHRIKLEGGNSTIFYCKTLKTTQLIQIKNLINTLTM